MKKKESALENSTEKELPISQIQEQRHANVRGCNPVPKEKNLTSNSTTSTERPHNPDNFPRIPQLEKVPEISPWGYLWSDNHPVPLNLERRAFPTTLNGILKGVLGHSRD